ncbi:MAG: hydroxysqualene dehydroxylase HpnE [Bryobacteraceae bacterium]
MAEVIIVGGGLAGLAAAAALGGEGHRVTVFESRPFLGGRATSFPLSSPGHDCEIIDNCQHTLLRCCVNLLDLYKRLGVMEHIRFHREFYYIEPGGRTSVFRAGALPAPFHFTSAFRRLHFLGFREKLAVARGLLALRRESNRPGLGDMTMSDWLREKDQPPRAIDRFWRPVLGSALNEELDRVAAAHAFFVFRLGFLARHDNYEMGVPAVPLGDLFGPQVWPRLGNVEIRLQSRVERICVQQGRATSVLVDGVAQRADCFISALPFERVTPVVPELGLDVSSLEHSPITGIHLWFDRSVTDLPHAVLLDRTIHWMFNKSGGRYLLLVVSASRDLLGMSRADVIALAVKELAEFFPAVRTAAVEKAHVVKEVRATFSARPGIESHRPPAKTAIPNLFLAGDWTRSGWPATMEGAVRSGYLAAEALTIGLGAPKQFVLPDLV